MNEQYYFSPERYLRDERDRKQIKVIGRVAGLCVIAYVVLQNLLTLPLVFEPLSSIYNSSPVFQDAVTILLSVFGLMLPFAIGGFYLRRRTNVNVFAFDRPVSVRLMVFAVFFGFFVCLAGNYASSVFVSVMDSIGFKLSSPDYEVTDDVFGRIAYFIMVAVVPPLTEELAIRGVIMQPLRRYGDRFAIVASAVLFAVLHGNLIQAPFAFIAGLGIGYAVCITGSLWTGVLIHFCNNAYSVLIEFMARDITDTALLGKAYNIVLIALYAVSIIGSVIFVMVKAPRKLTPPATTLSRRQRYGAFVLNIPMLIAIGIMIYITSRYVRFVG